ncbi:protein phosphatase regulator [Lecanora helva]
MTEVISITQPEGTPHFGSSLRRSSSQTSFLLQNSASYSRSSQDLKSRYAAVGYNTSRISASLPSSAPSSPPLLAPDLSNQPSYTSTPSSSLSLDDQCQTQEEVVFPSYDNDSNYDEIEDDPEPPPSPLTPGPATVTHSASDTCLSKPRLSEAIPSLSTAGDDSAIESEPTRHVDYLSYSWKEEDIWASWRHIVAKKSLYPNSLRLENASWRTWAKLKFRLKTVSPAALNWMKDHDVTWLYGPLQTGTVRPLRIDPTPPASQVSRSDSFASKKPILKRRTLSEIMLQRSLSSSTLMKQATDALRAQQPAISPRERPGLGDRVLSDFASEFGVPLTRSTTHPSTEASVPSSGLQTPCTKRHIHFNNKVEQCIAIDKEMHERLDYFNAIHDDEDEPSEDDMLIMKPVKETTKARISSGRSTPRNSFSGDGKTIAMLPSTTLNYRGDSPEPREQLSRQKSGAWRSGSKLSPSPSQQTLRPSSSANFLLDDEDEDVDMNWQPSPTTGRRDSLYPRGGLQIDSDDEYDREHNGLHRTPSGMFMPYEDEEDAGSTGILGKVVDTVNTAKDIAHVIWNVGWHR